MLNVAREFTEILAELSPKARQQAIRDSETLAAVAQDLLSRQPIPPASNLNSKTRRGHIKETK